LLSGLSNGAIARQLGIRPETVSRYLKERKERILGQMPERQMALLNKGINQSLDHLAKIEVLIKYELDRIFDPAKKHKEPPKVPITLSELFKTAAIIRRDLIRYSGAEQPLKHLVAVGITAAKNANGVEIQTAVGVTINLCDSEYGEFGEGRIKVRRREPAGTEDSPIPVAEASAPVSTD
jgi:predicted transcriptional regulator